VRAIIGTRPDLDAQDKNGWTALHFAAQEGDAEVVELLIAAGASLNVRDKYGNTPLFRAVMSYRGVGDVPAIFIRHGAGRDVANDSGVTPRELAGMIANYDVRKFFSS
jgi:ankyrin repeat protein